MILKTILISVLLSIILKYMPSDKVIKLSGKPEIFATDNLGNCYIYRENLLEKISDQGKIIASYSSYDSGKLSAIDSSDPMQLLLFYKDFNQIVLLDSKLNQIGKALSLDLLDLSSVSAVCKSKFFAVWIFDEYQEKLIHYGFNPLGILISINLNNYKKELGNVEYMVESGNEIFLKGKGNNIWVFDQFGKLVNKVNLKIENEFQLKNNTIVYAFKNKVVLYNLQDGIADTIQVKGFNSFDKVHIENNQLYVLNQDSIKIMAMEK